MKSKLVKILGVGLSLILALSLAVPVLADISEPEVDVDDDEIDATTEYAISFRINDDLDEGDWIEVEFPDDTDVDGTVTLIEISGTAGIGSEAFGPDSCTFYMEGETPPGENEVDEQVIHVIVPDVVLGTFIGHLAYVELVIYDVKNPSEPDDYVLEVRTEEEDDWVESASYEIDVPTVGGGVYVYNASDILLDVFGGDNAIMDCADPDDDGFTDDSYFLEDDYTIRVEPGDYELTDYIEIYGEDLTFKSTDGAEDTVIDMGDYWFDVYGEGVTIDGLTMEEGWDSVYIMANEVTVTDCIFVEDQGAAVYEDGYEDCVITGNEFEDCETAIYLYGSIDTEVSENEIYGTTGDGGIYIEYCDGVEITENDIHENENAGIYFHGDDNTTDVVIELNMISENEEEGILFDDTGGYPYTEIEVSGNEISNNEGAGILIEDEWSDCNAISFNDIFDNDDNLAIDDHDVNAVFNWWGSADEDDVEDGLDEGGDGDIEYEPWLMDTQASVMSGYKIALDDDGLDAKDEAGVKVSGVEDADEENVAYIILGSRYIDNPEEDLEDAIGFFDVYIFIDDDEFDIDEDTLFRVKLYDSEITEGDMVYFWTGDFWGECTDTMVRTGLAWAAITEDTFPAVDELWGTAFAVVAAEPEEDVEPAPIINVEVPPAPDVTVSVPDITVEAPSVTVEAPPAPSVTVEAPPAPSVTVEAPPAPSVTVEAPPAPNVDVAPPFDPVFLWVIIAIGAILMIAVIVLIVRTRRVA
jgi:parallel beta-helix repeat protein